MTSPSYDSLIDSEVLSDITEAAQPSIQFGRHRALLVGISYRELLNTHQDVDRYRNVLIGTHAATPSKL